jgi:hypothetical protein
VIAAPLVAAELPRTPPRDGIGYFVQAGFLIPHLPVELIGHWGQIFGLGDRDATSLANSDQAGAGLSWYIAPRLSRGVRGGSNSLLRMRVVTVI